VVAERPQCGVHRILLFDIGGIRLGWNSRAESD
jgi:hypothetical protein